MARLSFPFASLAAHKPAALAQPASSVAFDGLMVALVAWLVGGLYLDGWAHNHILTLDTFFTSWHAILYSGFAAGAGLLVFTWARNLWRGHAWARAMPVGYELSLLGVLIFTAGGVGDLIWHSLFGIEANIEALLSPTHLTLALGGSLITLGPLRAAWARRARESSAPGALALLPMLLSATLFLSVLTFFTQFISPVGETVPGMNHLPFGTQEFFHFQALGIAEILIQTGLLMGVVLFLVRGWTLPFGSLTFLLTLNTLLMVLMSDRYLITGPQPMVGIAFLSGVAGDLILARLQPSAARPWAFRVFAFALPLIFYALYFAVLMLLAGGTWWSIHLWAGSCVLAGIVGWLLSYAVLQPA